MQGRDVRGKFAPGNPGGPGRPRRSVEADYLRCLGEACTLEVWAEIVAAAAKAAKAGDAQARSWLGKYLLGVVSLRDSLTGEEKTAHMLEGIG